jgi:hypothetical protein
MLSGLANGSNLMGLVGVRGVESMEFHLCDPISFRKPDKIKGELDYAEFFS